MFLDFLLMPYLYSSSLHWRVETLARQNQDLIVCRSISDELSASSTHEFAIVSISSQTLVFVASPPHPTATISTPHCNVGRSRHLQRQFSAALNSTTNSTSSRSFECRLEYYK
ncbi:unnamed protein product [Brassica oleracea var. botrytis]